MEGKRWMTDGYFGVKIKKKRMMQEGRQK